jgi:hypothetical protein
LLAIIESRKYVDGLNECLEIFESDPEKTIKLVVRIPMHYSRVYQSHVDRIGVIDPDFASKVIRFHQLIDAIVQDVTPGGVIAEHGGGKPEFEQLAQILTAAIEIGKSLLGNKF